MTENDCPEACTKCALVLDVAGSAWITWDVFFCPPPQKKKKRLLVPGREEVGDFFKRS